MRLLLVLLFVSPFVFADERIQLPDGSGCWRNDVGHVYGCSGGPARGAGAGRSEPKCKWITEKEWKACERKKDWPGQPANCDHLLPDC